jgi:predicted metal-dependent hydrolase
VRDHLIATARRELGRRARGLAARLGRKVTRIRVGDPASHWGSCSAAGSLSFSWRLILAPEPVLEILAPEPVLDYVVAHEVAHLSEMNHGPSFWRLVGTLSPDSAVARDWLKRHRGRLLSYG